MAPKILPGVLSRAGKALERPFFNPDKLVIAVKLDTTATDLLDIIRRQYTWFQVHPSAKPYARILIKRQFLPYEHPQYSDQHRK
jgi:hypothetical protein